MAHELKFKVGDTVRVVQDIWTPISHGVQLGDTRTIECITKESRTGEQACNYQEYKLSCGGWCAEDELEAV